MSAGADEFCAVPGQEVSGGLTYACRVSQQTQTDGATLSLIAEGPAEGEEERTEGADALEILRGFRCDGCAEVGEVERSEVNDGQDESELAPEEIQRRSLMNQRRVWGFAGYSPRGSEVVAGRARRARKRVKVKMPKVSGMRSARETQSKLAGSSSGWGMKRRQVPAAGVCEDDGSRRAMTYPRVVAGDCGGVIVGLEQPGVYFAGELPGAVGENADDFDGAQA